MTDLHELAHGSQPNAALTTPAWSKAERRTPIPRVLETVTHPISGDDRK